MALAMMNAVPDEGHGVHFDPIPPRVDAIINAMQAGMPSLLSVPVSCVTEDASEPGDFVTEEWTAKQEGSNYTLTSAPCDLNTDTVIADVAGTWLHAELSARLRRHDERTEGRTEGRTMGRQEEIGEIGRVSKRKRPLGNATMRLGEFEKVYELCPGAKAVRSRTMHTELLNHTSYKGTHKDLNAWIRTFYEDQMKSGLVRQTWPQHHHCWNDFRNILAESEVSL